MLERTWVDRLIGKFSPKAERLRLQNRAATDALVRHFEGGSGGRRTENWRTPSTGANSAGAATLETLRNRSRDLVRNNPFARNAIEDLETETVGTGIVAKIKGRTKRATAGLSELWREWAETTQCDADGLHDLYGLQALAFRTIAESGEVLIRRRRRRTEDRLPLPFQLQILEPDHLDTGRDTFGTNGTRIVGGVEFDARGRRVAYWLFPEHPGEATGLFLPGKGSLRIPADEILHLFRSDRPGQVRGIPWGASAIVRLRDFDEYEDAQLVRQKIAACFAVFLTNPEGQSPGALAGVPEEDVTDEQFQSGQAWASKPGVERVYPGMIQRLGPGDAVTFGTPPSVEDHDGYSRTVLRGVAAGFGTTYEAVTGDYAGMPFSSSRLSWIRHHRRVEAWRWRIMVPRFCAPVWSWALEVADVLGVDVREASASWSPPRRDVLDPKTEVAATRSEIRAGLKSLSGALRERGDDPAEVFAELAEDRDLLDELGLILESDARRPSNGQPGDPAATGSGSNPPAEPAPAGDGEEPADPDEEPAPAEDEAPAPRRRRRGRR